MTPQEKTPPRETFGFLSHRRAVPIVETPSRWPVIVLGTLVLFASAIAGLVMIGA